MQYNYTLTFRESRHHIGDDESKICVVLVAEESSQILRKMSIGQPQLNGKTKQLWSADQFNL